MKRIIGIGETQYNIVFKNSQPYKGRPSGFVFNSIISLGRLGLKPILISEIGKDFIGEIIIDILKSNNIQIDNLYRFYATKTALSLTMDNNIDIESNINTTDIDTTSYLDYPSERLDIVWPRIDVNDIIYFGSYFSIDPNIRKPFVDIINYAINRKSILFYNVDLEKKYAQKTVWLMPSIIENLEFADIVIGMKEDFVNIYKDSEIDKIYNNHIKFYCTNFICTTEKGNVILKSVKSIKEFYLTENQKIRSKSAYEAFLAGVIYGFTKYKIDKENVYFIDADIWDRIIDSGICLAENVNLNNELYISQECAQTLTSNIK